MDIRDAAAILGVPPDATIEQVRDAFRSHARLLHPDRLGEASQKDQQTAHEAMARINGAYAVFQARLRVEGTDPRGRPSVPEPRDRSSNPRPKPLAQFDALLSHPRGWDLTGVLRIIRAYGGRVSAVFESDDLDARGTPVFDEEVFVATSSRAPQDGTLALRGGGYLVVMGARWQAERVLTLLGLDPSLAHPKGRSNRRVLLFAGAGIVALIASMGVVAAVANVGVNDAADKNTGADPTVSPAQTITSMTLTATPTMVTVGEVITLAAKVTSPQPGIEIELQLETDGRWQPIDTALTNDSGDVDWSRPAGESAGVFAYRVGHPSETSPTFSEVVEVTVIRAPTETLTVRWPEEPAAYCESQTMTVNVTPADVGRAVALQYTADRVRWLTADEATLNGRGRTRLQTPGCESVPQDARASASWRVVAETTDSRRRATSDPQVLPMLPRPAECPSPGPVTIVQAYKWLVDVVNPSSKCAAQIVVSSGIYCEIPPPDIRNEFVGVLTSNPVYLGPGEGLRVDMSELFPGACPSPPYNGMGLAFPNLTGFATYSPPS